MNVLRKNLVRTVVLKQIPPSVEVISSLPSGRIHQISRENNGDSLVINFLDSRSATHFTNKFLSLPRLASLKDTVIDYGKPLRLPVQTLAAIGLKNASRVVRVSSNNGKNIPSDLEKDLAEFGIENFKVDSRSAIVHFFSIEAATEALDALRSNTAYAGYSVYFGLTVGELVRRIESGLPNLNRELIQSINYNPRQRKAYINFFDPAVAKIIHDSFNMTNDSDPLLSVSWFRSKSPISPVSMLQSMPASPEL
ncbi:hypothetical protein D9757_005909 [Collybiopsis confluens]|uniref:Uncharacterized protein n=1 Tax=Collybiopsis confluens TaxID=2823264 RepID=A0A8H5HN00_9AGAR|nr:hypothetical protein D9757_005909 [Collybiopsis confluens]